jgi:hypothetical protein
MATQYPPSLPQPLVSGFTAAVGSGVLRAEPGAHQQQRRVHETMPHLFTMSFMMTVLEWDSWSRWVARYGYRWFEIEIPTMYAGSIGANKSPVLLRFTSASITAEAVSGDTMRITVTAEIAPSMISLYLEDVP